MSRHDAWCDGSGSSAGGVCCRRATELQSADPTQPWWRDGAMVIEADGELDDDQHFVADAATEDDAQRLVDWHNEAIRQLQRERDLAIAHDRQPYPTAAAYEAVCAALARCKADLGKQPDDLTRAGT